MSCAYCKNITVCAICGKGYAEGLADAGERPRASDLPVGSMTVRDHCTETQWNHRRNELQDGKYLVYVVRVTR